MLGQLFDGAAASRIAGRRVLVKANFNSPHRFPASSAPDFLEVVIRVLKSVGAAGVSLGDSCGLRWRPAERVARALGMPELAKRLGAEWVDFDAGRWREVPVAGRMFRSVSVCEAALDAEFLVYACCAKTHPAAGFSLSLKHTTGCLPPEQRAEMHDGEMARRIAEINLAVKPDLVLLDARRCFAAGGPAIGLTVRPGLLVASADRVAADVEGLRILGRYRLLNRLRKNPWEEPQIREAVTLGIGASGDDGCEVIQG